MSDYSGIPPAAKFSRIALPRFRAGFSLVLSLTVMAMLLVLCLGAAALLGLEMRAGRASVAVSVARLNAVSALRMAVGELQAAAGPDRRVTAPLGLLTKTGTKPAPGDRWTGVWRTDRLKAETPGAPPLLYRDAATGSLRDRRQAGAYVAANEILETLVSRSDPAVAPGRDVALAEGDNAIRLLGAGSLLEGSVADDGVVVPRLRAKNAAGETTGVFAWWVGDEGVKARTDLRDPYPENGGDIARRGRVAPALSGLGAVDGLASLARTALPGDAAARESLSPRAPGIVAGMSRDVAAARFHDLAAGTFSVLADPLRGGLKKDLTAYLLSSGEIPDEAGVAGVKDMDPLVDYAPEKPERRETAFFAKSAPRFGILRDWASVRASAGGAARVTPRPMDQMSPGISGASAYHDGINASQVDMTRLKRQAVEPILTEASFFLRLVYDPAYDPAKPDSAKFRLQIYPRFQLWNPYNVTLTGKDYFAHIRMLSPLTDGQTYFEVTGGDGKKTNVPFNLPRWTNIGSTRGSLTFVLRAGDIAPGECSVYTPAAVAGHYNRDNPAANVLSPAPSGRKNYFYLDSGDPIGGSKVLDGFAAINPVGGTYCIGAAREDDVSFMLKEIPQGTTTTTPDAMAAAPMVMYASASPQFGSSATVGPKFLPVPLTDWAEDAAPEDSERHGLRFRWISETAGNRDRYAPAANVDVSLLGDFNVRSSINYRYPWDNNTPVNAPLFWTLHYIRDYPDPRTGWKTPPVVAGRAAGNPFAGIGEWNRATAFTLFDLPEAPGFVGSLAAFRHARVSEFPWHPTYAAGESLISPSVPADVTCRPVAESAAAWNAMGTGYQYAKQAMQNLTDTEQPVYDQSYELNTTLYDRFFLSTGDAAAKDRFVADPRRNPLPDARLVPNPASTSPDRAAALKSWRRSAGELLVAGGFNVNSTSVEAWRALFASLRDVPLGKTATTGATAFSRVGEPLAGGADASGLESAPEANSGFRKLTDAQLLTLAQKTVEEVRLRGPFLSVSDFVNRRLAKNFVRPATFSDAIPASFCGTLQAAIERSGLNAGMQRPETALAAGGALSGSLQLTDQKAVSKTYGLPGNLTQGDLLQALDPLLAARSDTFRIRVAGETAEGSGVAPATVYLEATVQRFPDPVRADAGGLEPARTGGRDFGRRFRILSLRSLSPDEI